MTYSWVKNGETVIPDQEIKLTGPNLTITNLSMIYDEKVFRCRVIEEGGTWTGESRVSPIFIECKCTHSIPRVSCGMGYLESCPRFLTMTPCLYVRIGTSPILFGLPGPESSVGFQQWVKCLRPVSLFMLASHLSQHALI